jgi:hypothetical protein
MKPRADLQQRRNPPFYLDPPRSLPRHPRKNLQQSRFARPIPPNNPQHLAPPHLKRNILERIDPVRRRRRRKMVLQNLRSIHYANQQDRQSREHRRMGLRGVACRRQPVKARVAGATEANQSRESRSTERRTSLILTTDCTPRRLGGRSGDCRRQPRRGEMSGSE